MSIIEGATVFVGRTYLVEISPGYESNEPFVVFTSKVVRDATVMPLADGDEYIEFENGVKIFDFIWRDYAVVKLTEVAGA